MIMNLLLKRFDNNRKNRARNLKKLNIAHFLNIFLKAENAIV